MGNHKREFSMGNKQPVQDDRELIQAAYRAFNARDIDAVLALMHSNVDWPNGMEGGRVHGHAEVRDYWLRQWKILDPHVEPIGFTDVGDGQTIVDVRQVVRDRSGNLLLDRTVQHVYSIRHGLIERMEIREETD
jgi:hypothetical protein